MTSPPGSASDRPSSRSKIAEQHTPLAALIRDTLRGRIMSGELKTGDRLPEGRVAEEMGASRVPVREALRELASEGLVTVEPRRGASVAFVSEEMANDLVEVRATLEGLNARLATQRRNEQALAALQEVLEQGIAAVGSGDADVLADLNYRFHELVATAAGNVVLTDMMRSLRARTAMLFGRGVERARENWDEHAQILRAIISGNAELASLLAAQHVHNAARAYLEKRKR